MMINTQTADRQKTMREEYLKEYEALCNEYGVKPVPLGPYALVRCVDFDRKTSGGIVIPADERDDETMRIGLVLEFGPIALKGYEGTRGPSDWGVTAGDFVEFDRHAGSLSSYPQFRKHYRIINAADLYTVYKD